MVLQGLHDDYKEGAFLCIHVYQKTHNDIWETSFDKLKCKSAMNELYCRGIVYLHSNNANPTQYNVADNNTRLETSVFTEGVYVIVICHNKPGRKRLPYQFSVVGDKMFEI